MQTPTLKSEGRLLALLTASFYGLFTLLPDSHSLMVQWPWVAIWQIGLVCGVIWLLSIIWEKRCIPLLGNGLDWCIGLGIVGLLISTIFAEFSDRARWSGWAVLCFIAALYAVNGYLRNRDRRYQLLTMQGYIAIGFILISLSLWTTQTLLPELTRLASLRRYGIDFSFDFSVLELRNWAPLGHQNYVAGYLVLILPLLAGLGIVQTRWRRWLWLAGVGLGLLDLYSTSSRGGWLGLFALFIFAIAVLLLGSRLPKIWLIFGSIGSLAILFLLAFANNRLRSLLLAILQNSGGGELAYRLINATLGWKMGSSHPLTGIGIGGVPFAYQKYRPIWAGRESEIAYQLHSTPVHLWAEMGIWGIIPVLGAIALLTYLLLKYWLRRTAFETPSGQGRRQEADGRRDFFKGDSNFEQTDWILLLSLYGGLIAYGVMSLTDYQLDNVAISGTIVIYVAWIASSFGREKANRRQRDGAYKGTRQPREARMPNYFGIQSAVHTAPPDCRRQKEGKIAFYFGLGILLTALIWLIPVHRAWLLSSQGFAALSQDKIEPLVDRLTKANQLAPWESYYPYQLGWNLGNLALQSKNPQQQQQLIKGSITWLEKANTVSPHQEFGFSNLGWLLLQSDPPAASQAFIRAIQLVPAKRGLMFGLGLSLLEQSKVEQAVEAFSLEGVRDPLFMTSPIWRSPALQPIYLQVRDRMIKAYTDLLQQYSQPGALNTYLHRSRGGLFWWNNNFAAASQDLTQYGTPLSQEILALAEGKIISAPQHKLIQAWANPSQRPLLLKQAWIEATKTELSPEMERNFLASLERSQSFDQWLKQFAPVWQYRRERSGFGVVNRHIDGSIPTDFWIVVENLAMMTWFEEILPSPVYMPELDLALQAWRETFINSQFKQG